MAFLFPGYKAFFFDTLIKFSLTHSRISSESSGKAGWKSIRWVSNHTISVNQFKQTPGLAIITHFTLVQIHSHCTPTTYFWSLHINFSITKVSLSYLKVLCTRFQSYSAFKPNQFSLVNFLSDLPSRKSSNILLVLQVIFF